MSTEDTVRWYEEHAEDYFSRTIDMDSFPGLESDLCGFLLEIPMPGPIADIGSGSGRDAVYFASRGRRVIVLDLARTLLSTCVRHVSASGFRRQSVPVVADARRLPFATASLAGLWASGVYLHLSRPHIELAIEEAARVLGVGGVLGVSMKLGSGQVIRDGRQFTLVDAEELSKIVLAQGLEVISVTGPVRRDWLLLLARKV